MKRFVVAAGAVVLTGVLVLLAMAVAQRDARVSDASAIDGELPYANQAAQPISVGTGSENNSLWPPAPPIVRGNDSDNAPAFVTTQDARGLTRATPTSYSSIGDKNTGDNLGLAEPPPMTGSWNRGAGSTFENTSNLPSNGSSPTSGLLPSSTLPPKPSAALPGNSLVDSAPPTLGLPSTPPNTLPSAPSYSPFATAPTASTLPPLPVASSNNADYQGVSEGTSNDLADPPPATLGSPTLPNSASPSNSLPNNSLPVSAPPALMPNSSAYRNPSTDRAPLPSTTPSLPVGLSTSGPTTNLSPSYPPVRDEQDSPTLSAPPSFPSTKYNNPSLPPEVNSRNTAVSGQGYASPAPGGHQLDGSQNPSMEIQKRAPNEVQVGVPATFTLLVKNVGNATAYDVNVVDAVPKGAKLVRTEPQAQQTGASGLVWKLGEMAARTEKVLTIELIPETEGEIGSVASVNFGVQASVRTMSTQPKLMVKQILDPMVLGGENLLIMIEVANTGTGTARDVRLEEDVPENMRHTSGAKVLGMELGDLAPGDKVQKEIELTAVAPGKVSNLIRAVSVNAATNESSAQIEIVAPKLQCNIEGPKKRYLESQATYTISVTNTGTAIAKNVDLILHLPSGMQFNSTEKHGEYIPSQHAVMWQLAELAAGKTASVKLTLLPITEGDCVLLMKSQGDGVRAEPFEKTVHIEGQSELIFSIEDDVDPVDVEGRTTYLIKITNIGTRADSNVELSVDLPDGAALEQVDAPVNYREAQRSVVFAPIQQLQPKDQQLIRLAVRHTREGTHVIRARVKSKLREVPVIKEESTLVYRDQ